MTKHDMFVEHEHPLGCRQIFTDGTATFRLAIHRETSGSGRVSLFMGLESIQSIIEGPSLFVDIKPYLQSSYSNLKRVTMVVAICNLNCTRIHLSLMKATVSGCRCADVRFISVDRVAMNRNGGKRMEPGDEVSTNIS